MKSNVEEIINLFEIDYSNILIKYYEICTNEEQKKLRDFMKENKIPSATRAYVRQKKIVSAAKGKKNTKFEIIEDELLSVLLLIEIFFEELKNNTYKPNQNLKNELIEINTQFKVQTLSKDELSVYKLLIRAKELLTINLHKFSTDAS